MKKPVTAFVFVTLLTGCSAQQKDTGALAKFVQQKTEEVFAGGKVPGILVFYRNNGQAGFYTTGVADPGSKKTFDENTFFEIGSITKTFTAYVLMSVLSDKGIRDTEPVLPYLPDSVRKNTSLAAIRFTSLMNHTSGLPRLPANMELEENDLQPYAQYDSKKMFAYLKSAKPSAGGKYEYSNLGAALAGVLAERISGNTYAALLEKYIFLPFNMTDKNNSLQKPANKSIGLIDDSTKAEYWNMDVMAPAGGLKCTAKEMAAYLDQMSRPATRERQRLVDSLTSATCSLSPVMGVGRGWHYFSVKNKPVIHWHNGGTYGFSTFAAFVKGTGQWVMVVVNRFDKNDTVSDKLGMQVINKMTE